jgi:hypothetical protein
MNTLEDYIKSNFIVGNVKFKAEAHVTPNGVINFKLISHDLEELDCIVVNNLIKVIANE